MAACVQCRPDVSESLHSVLQGAYSGCRYCYRRGSVSSKLPQCHGCQIQIAPSPCRASSVTCATGFGSMLACVAPGSACEAGLNGKPADVHSNLQVQTKQSAAMADHLILHCHSCRGRPRRKYAAPSQLHFQPYRGTFKAGHCFRASCCPAGWPINTVARPCGKASLTLGKARSQQEGLREVVGGSSKLLNFNTIKLPHRDRSRGWKCILLQTHLEWHSRPAGTREDCTVHVHWAAPQAASTEIDMEGRHLCCCLSTPG